MSDLKYSLKTKEFSKRKYHIFPQKQHQPPTKQEPQQKVSQHALQKKPIPYSKNQLLNSQLTPALKNQEKQQNFIEVLTLLKGILIENESKISQIQQNVNNMYKETVQAYNQHEKYLRGVVRQKCDFFTKMMKVFLKNLDKKDENLFNLDKRVTTFQNTLRSTYEILRTTKIKQDCIEVMISSRNEIKQKTNSIIKQSNKRMTKTLQQKDYHFQKDKKLKIQQFWDNQPIITESIYSKDPDSSFFRLEEEVKPEYSESERDQVSPFEANQYLLMSKVPKPPSQYSFQQNYQDYCKVRKQILNLRGQIFPIQARIDDLGYIRRKNGTYIFDERGNVLFCEKINFNKLTQEGIIRQV